LIILTKDKNQNTKIVFNEIQEDVHRDIEDPYSSQSLEPSAYNISLESVEI
jgi:hypothetical protein